MSKEETIFNLVIFKPSLVRFFYFIIGAILVVLGFLTFDKIGFGIDCLVQWFLGLGFLIDGGLKSTANWYLKQPKSNDFDLYKIGDNYVSTTSLDEARLWADLKEIDAEPERIGIVSQFER